MHPHRSVHDTITSCLQCTAGREVEAKVLPLEIGFDDGHDMIVSMEIGCLPNGRHSLEGNQRIAIPDGRCCLSSEVANDLNDHATGTHDLTADSRFPTTLQLSAAGPGLHTLHASHAEAQTIMRQPEKLPRSRQGSSTPTPTSTTTTRTAIT
ncbi:hypothetical protein QR685DRAFT_588019 [Neurospora intermedia]|uniref:Uncharacterized protein n=1 Tax=Neurospora intermedia TaxID=5142 RepID=A0ABR3DGN7_NEUIN